MQPGPAASDAESDEDDPSESEGAFAGLEAIDIVDGELVPRRSRRP